MTQVRCRPGRTNLNNRRAKPPQLLHMTIRKAYLTVEEENAIESRPDQCRKVAFLPSLIFSTRANNNWRNLEVAKCIHGAGEVRGGDMHSPDGCQNPEKACSPGTERRCRHILAIAHFFSERLYPRTRCRTHLDRASAVVQCLGDSSFAQAEKPPEISQCRRLVPGDPLIRFPPHQCFTFTGNELEDFSGIRRAKSLQLEIGKILCRTSIPRRVSEGNVSLPAKNELSSSVRCQSGRIPSRGLVARPGSNPASCS